MVGRTYRMVGKLMLVAKILANDCWTVILWRVSEKYRYRMVGTYRMVGQLMLPASILANGCWILIN